MATYTSAPISLGPVLSFTLSGTQVGSSTPYAALYLAPDSSGNLQLWSFPLTDTSTVPTPAQHGQLSLPVSGSSAGTVCGENYSYGNLLQPTSTFAIVQYAVSPNTCASGTTTTALINWSDSTSTAPTTLPLGNWDIEPLYSAPSGQLTSLIGLDTAGNLKLYTAANGAPSFSTSTTIASNVVTYDNESFGVNRNGQVFSSSVVFSTVSFVSGPAQIFRTDTTGAHTSIYTATGSIASGEMRSDNTNIYFVDSVTAGGNITFNFYAAPIAGGNATRIYSATTSASAATTYNLIDSDGTRLYIALTNNSSGERDIYSVAVAGPASQTAASVVQFTGVRLLAGLDFATGDLFVTETTSGLSQIGQILRPGSSPGTLAGPTTGVVYSPLWSAATLSSTGSTWLSVTGVGTDGTYGGGKLQMVSTTTGASSGSPFVCPLCASGSNAYTVPTGGYPTLMPMTSSVAYGQIDFADETATPALGVIANYLTGSMVVLTPPSGSNLSVF